MHHLVAAETENNIAIGVVLIFGFVGLVAAVLIGGLVVWGALAKAGEPPWAGFVPFYGTYVMTRVAGYNPWMFLLLLIPVVNIVFSIMIALGVGRAFGKDGVFSFFLLWLLSPIGYLIVGYGGAEFVGRGGIRNAIA